MAPTSAVRVHHHGPPSSHHTSAPPASNAIHGNTARSSTSYVLADIFVLSSLTDLFQEIIRKGLDLAALILAQQHQTLEIEKTALSIL